jgi:hypothetical protein
VIKYNKKSPPTNGPRDAPVLHLDSLRMRK